jgi:hypothetical protein
MALACSLLGASGGVRAWQDFRFATVEGKVKGAPFPLKDLPRTLGDDWKVEEGGEGDLDPEVKQVAGCTDSLIRTYRNTTTGVSVTALLLYGPGKAVAGHTPEVCYPAGGYRSVAEPSILTIAAGPEAKADFRSQVFARDLVHQTRREEVYYSFRHGNRWTPDAQRYWKDFRQHPALFKVQTQRPVSSDEWRQVNNPTEEFLALLMPEIERRIAGGQERGEK